MSKTRNPSGDGMAEQQASALLGSEVREGYATSATCDCTTSRPERGRWSFCCTASRSSGTAGGCRSTARRGGIPVVAPDMRGYNLSSRPKGVKAYGTDQLTADIRGLIQECGGKSRDWSVTTGAESVAWATAMNYPEVVDRLAILNAAHPRKLSQGLHHPSQLRKSWYFFSLQSP